QTPSSPTIPYLLPAPLVYFYSASVVCFYSALDRICLDKPDLVEAGLVRKPGVDLGLFDELSF
ncbi:MAG: hypothetical protein WBQ43_21030, partial [Terriglobales bacterium]